MLSIKKGCRLVQSFLKDKKLSKRDDREFLTCFFIKGISSKVSEGTNKAILSLLINLLESNELKRKYSQEIVKRANALSAQLVSDAEFKSKELRRVASEYVDDILRRTEETVGAALHSINESRANFRSLAGAANAEAEPEEETEE